MKFCKFLLVPAVILAMAAGGAAQPKPKAKPSKGGKKAAAKLSPEVADLLKRIDQLSGKIEYDANGAIVGLDLSKGQTTDADLERLKLLPEIERLTLFGPEIHNAGVQHLGALRKLRELVLENTEISEEGLVALTSLPELKSIVIEDTSGITDAGIAKIAQYLKGLEEIDLFRCAAVTDAGLAPLAGLAGLRRVKLRGSPVTGAALAQLCGLGSLNSLNLEETKITDVGLARLAGLKGLKTLSLKFTQVTDAAVAELQKALPGCTITK